MRKRCEKGEEVREVKRKMRREKGEELRGTERVGESVKQSEKLESQYEQRDKRIGEEILRKRG